MARFLILGAAFLFSTGGAAIKATSLGGWETAGLRSLIAAIALLGFVPESRKGWSWRIFPIGLFYAATLILFVIANKLTTSANAIFLQSTAPAYLLLLGPLILKEPVRRADIWLSIALAAGMAMFFAGVEAPRDTALDPARGNGFAALSGASYALTLTGIRWQAQRAGGGAIAAVAAGNVFAFLLCAPAAFPLPALAAPDFLVLLYLGFIQVGASYWLLTRGMKKVPAFEASALLLMEPVLNPFWSWLLHGEKPGVWALGGGALILTATLWATLSHRGD